MVTTSDDVYINVPSPDMDAASETQWTQQSHERDLLPSRSCWLRVQRSWRRVRPTVPWLALYVTANIVGFALRYAHFPHDAAAGRWPGVAKGSAECVLLNTALALLSVCYHSVRHIRSIVMRWVSQRFAITVFTPVDQHVAVHRLAGTIVLLASLVHSIAWLRILVALRTCSTAVYERSTYSRHTFLRDAPALDLLTQLPIWTGLLLVGCVAVVAPFALPRVRAWSYRVFVLAHMAFVPFTAVLLFHGAACWVGTLQAPFWLLVPIFIFASELYERRATPGSSTRIEDVDNTGDVVILTLAMPQSFRATLQPGMFVFVHVPAVSRLEWHPFSVTSAPQDAMLQLHIRQVGDWTRALARALTHEPSSLAVRLNGPMGAPAAHIVRYHSVVFVAAGMGITPFLSALRYTLFAWRQALESQPQCSANTRAPASVLLVWVTRTERHVHWVGSILDEFHDVLAHGRYQHAIEIRVHLTGASVTMCTSPASLTGCSDSAESIEATQAASGSSCNSLRADTVRLRLSLGRPVWRALFSDVVCARRGGAIESSQRRIGVFICANPALASQVKDAAAAASTADVALDTFSESF